MGERIFVIHDFWTREECEAHIAWSEQEGYEAAPITTPFGAVMREDVRNNRRVMRDDFALSEAIFQRAQPFLPSRLGIWHLKGINERFRYYRYDVGQTFAPHYDGSFDRNAYECSQLTFMVYLNDGFTGGSTRFYYDDGHLKADVVPKQGMALVFQHLQLHEGVTVEAGRKYALRTDVMYTRAK